MKLKYKLYLSYFLLVFFFSITLVLLDLHLRSTDQFIRMRTERDIQEVLDLSRQQQIVEKVYAQFLLTRFSGPAPSSHQTKLKLSLENFRDNWQLYQSRRDSVIQYSSAFPLSLIEDLFLTGRPDSITGAEERNQLESQIQMTWTEASMTMMTAAQDTNRKITVIKTLINRIRLQISQLSTLIGTQNRDTGKAVAHFFSVLNAMILVLFVFFIALGLAVTYLITRRFFKPLEGLKSGIEQIAIQNYDVKIAEKSTDEIGELAAAFEQMALRLKEHEKFKSEMLNQFTHEMKSPLAAIYQAMSLLEHSLGGNPTDNQKRLLSIINGNNETLSNLITNILHSASYDAENMPLNLHTENIVKVFTNSIIKLAPTIKQKEIKVDLNFASEKIETDIDKDRMEEVFFNLLSNAIKFSPKTSTLKVSVYENESFVDIKLQDQGIGIPKKEIPYIFEKMYRASNSKKISVKGTGLGLYITAQIVKAHGGKIRVVSKEKAGTEFTVQLPKTHRRGGE